VIQRRTLAGNPGRFGAVGGRSTPHLDGRRLLQSFHVPLVIMGPIRLTLVGILPVHAFIGAFTARSIIGFFVGAGIIVRDSSMRLETSFQAGEKLLVARHSRFRATSTVFESIADYSSH
jgi:multidrug efflux pump subunit AcrB